MSSGVNVISITFRLAVAPTSCRIIHIFEDNKSLLCYKHVV
jgi:hypothetical protein